MSDLQDKTTKTSHSSVDCSPKTLRLCAVPSPEDFIEKNAYWERVVFLSAQNCAPHLLDSCVRKRTAELNIPPDEGD